MIQIPTQKETIAKPAKGKSNGVPQPLQADSHRGSPVIEAIYFHVPFCFHKCHYCDFYSIVDSHDPASKEAASPTMPPARQQPFLDRMLAELHYRASQAAFKPRTIFVGGGTPTLLSPSLWQHWLKVMREAGILENVIEFTVEANPETVTAELMEVLANGGVNRVSLGAQSFNPTLLKVLERWHDPSAVGRAVQIVRNAGIGNINLDLIFAIPGQTMDMLDADLDTALSLGPTHLSCYSLIFEPNTAMAQRMKMGRIAPVDEEVERAMYARVIERLAAAGFKHYEVSNWAQGTGTSSSRACEHNLLYWRNANWLGIGPGAASHVDGFRWKNEPHLGRYLALAPEPPTVDHEHLPADQSLGEQLMLRLRLLDGVSIDWLRSHLPERDARYSVIDDMIRIGMLERTATHIRLTREGLFIADAVLAKLL